MNSREAIEKFDEISDYDKSIIEKNDFLVKKARRVQMALYHLGYDVPMETLLIDRLKEVS